MAPRCSPQPHASENRVRVHDPGDPADLPLERLEHELCTLSSHLEAGNGSLARAAR
ncbi:MAG: hypothetical protein ACRDK1_08970 [Solirubrobacterales bacterium]